MGRQGAAEAQLMSMYSEKGPCIVLDIILEVSGQCATELLLLSECSAGAAACASACTIIDTSDSGLGTPLREGGSGGLGIWGKLGRNPDGSAICTLDFASLLNWL